MFHSPVEVHRQHVLRPRFLPRVPVAQPIISFFNLEEQQKEVLNMEEIMPNAGSDRPTLLTDSLAAGSSVLPPESSTGHSLACHLLESRWWEPKL